MLTRADLLAFYDEIKTVAVGVLAGILVAVTVWGHIPAPTPGPTPDPPPVPGPGPKPPPPKPQPTPVVGHLIAMAIYEYDTLQKLPAGQIDLRASSTISDSSKSLDVEWRNYDQDNPSITSWKPKAAEIGIPALLVIDEKGHLIKGEKLPADEAAALSLLKGLRGK